MVYNYNLSFTAVQRQVLEQLFQSQGSVLSQKQIAQNIGFSEMAVKKALVPLVEQSFVLLHKSENRTAIRINSENEFIMGLKRYWNILKVYSSGLESYLKDSSPGATIILFGSFARGDDIYNSDIDIAIIGMEKKDIPVSQFEKFFQKDIHISFFKNFREIHKNLKENLCNGIVLSGAITL